MPNTVSAGVKAVPWIASRPLGAMFSVTGTAATQYSRVAAEDADGAASRLAAPTDQQCRQASHWTVTEPPMKGWMRQ